MTNDEAYSLVAPLYDALTRPSEKDVAGLLTACLTDDWESLGSAGETSDRAHFIAKVAGFGRAIPDLAFAPQEVMVAGDRIIVRSEATGTPAGDFMGVGHSGKSFRIMTIDIHQTAAGRLTKAWHVEDWMTAVRQLRA
jgi:predicted ester cyclase